MIQGIGKKDVAFDQSSQQVYSGLNVARQRDGGKEILGLWQRGRGSGTQAWRRMRDESMDVAAMGMDEYNRAASKRI